MSRLFVILTVSLTVYILAVSGARIVDRPPLQVAADDDDTDADAEIDDTAFQGANELMSNFQRREWCARLGDNCVPETKLKFADCCPGYRCQCYNFAWQSGRCQCKPKSMLGR